MDKPVELVPLVCLHCATPLAAQPGEVAWVCNQCGRGMALDDLQGLHALEIHYARGIPPGTAGKPFWVAQGQVTLRRETYSGNEAQESERFWSQPRQFFIPAYACPLDTLLSLGGQMLLQPPVLVDGPQAAFVPVTFSAQDASSLAEFIVVAQEAGRRDMLKVIQFNLELADPVLWVLP